MITALGFVDDYIKYSKIKGMSRQPKLLAINFRVNSSSSDV